MDYADPLNPTPRQPVNLPAQLTGISHQGALLYTKGPRWDDKWQTDGTDYLAASAYDGVRVFLVDAVQVASNAGNAGQPTTLADGTVLVPVNQYDATSSTGLVQAWKLDSNGKLANLSNRKLSAPVSSIRVWDSLLAAQLNQTVELYNIANLADWLPLGSGQAAGYYWPDLTNADGTWPRDFSCHSVNMGSWPFRPCPNPSPAWDSLCQPKLFGLVLGSPESGGGCFCPATPVSCPPPFLGEKNRPLDGIRLIRRQR